MYIVPEVYTIACTALHNLFKKSTDWDACSDAVRLMAKVLMSKKVTQRVPSLFIRTLFSLQLNLKADAKKSLQALAKKEKRKRKRNRENGDGKDDISLQLMQSDSTNDQLYKDKHQTNCLHEVVLLYFRILKGKIGFRLLPIALEGLGRCFMALLF